MTEGGDGQVWEDEQSLGIHSLSVYEFAFVSVANVSRISVKGVVLQAREAKLCLFLPFVQRPQGEVGPRVSSDEHGYLSRRIDACEVFDRAYSTFPEPLDFRFPEIRDVGQRDSGKPDELRTVETDRLPRLVDGYHRHHHERKFLEKSTIPSAKKRLRRVTCIPMAIPFFLEGCLQIAYTIKILRGIFFLFLKIIIAYSMCPPST